MELRDMIKPEQIAMLEALRAARPTGSNREPHITPPVEAKHANWKSIPKFHIPPLQVQKHNPKIQLQGRITSAPKRVIQSKDTL